VIQPQRKVIGGLRMLKNKDVAQSISVLMIEFSSRINGSISMVKDQCSEAEFNEYRRAAGRVMGEMLLGIMNPIYKEHPDLKPPGLE